jgi:hypothetical protein
MHDFLDAIARYRDRAILAVFQMERGFIHRGFSEG